VGIGLYWRWANHLPEYPLPPVKLPVPNARADFVEAGRMCHAAGGATVLSGPSGAAGQPVLRDGQPLQGYQDGVTRKQRRAIVARNRAALARLRQGLRKQYHLDQPVVSFLQVFPENAHFRELARVLATEGLLAVQEGRPNAAVRSYLDCLHLGVEVPRGGPLIHGLTGLSIQSIGLSPLLKVVDRLDGPTAAAAAREMLRLEAQATSAADSVAAEKETLTWSMLETFKRPEVVRQMGSVIGDGEDAGELSDEDLLGLKLFLAVMPKRLIIDNMRRYMDALIANAGRPYYAQAPMPTMPRDPLNRAMLPIFDDARRKWTQSEAYWRIAQTRLAVRAYEQQHGQLPRSLSNLVPGYLPSVPQDPFAPKPLVNRRQGSRPLIYSRGPDGDDDGGRDLGTWITSDSDGDLVTMKSRKPPAAAGAAK
jgi:hypothetical protein